MAPLDQRQRQRLAGIRQRAHDQHRCDPVGIKEDVERRVGLRVFDDNLFLIGLLQQLGAEPKEKAASRVGKIEKEAQDAKVHDQEGVEKNHLAPVRLGVFADHDFLVGLIDQASEGRYKHDRSCPDPDEGPPPLNVEAGVVQEQEAGIPG